MLMRIQGRADKVFNAIENICRRNPNMTLAEAGKKGLLKPKLYHTEPYVLGKFPAVILDNGIENN